MQLFSQHILQRVTDFIAANHLLSVPPTTLYVGLSGGPDSVALLHILNALGYPCLALHCNFHLRDAESDRDQAFCRQLCMQLGIQLEVKSFDTRQYMQQQHLSLEMAARKLRYQWWETKKDGPIAIGHHADDSIETMLMNLMRGTGIHGMTGIVPRNEKNRVIRPLLCLSRQDILDYLDDNQLSYVTDSTNNENDTLRNQIRNQLLPLMEQMVPQCRHGIQQTMSHLQDTQIFADSRLEEFDWMTEQHEAWGIKWAELEINKLLSFFPNHEEAYLHDWVRKFCDPDTQCVRHDAQRYYTAPLDAYETERHKPAMEVLDYETQEPEQNDAKFQERFDADTVTRPLTLRRWQKGDRLAPLGMNGHTKLISDLFQNAHFSPMQKATTWVVVDAAGSILWVIGLRMSELHKITSQTTHFLRLSVK